MLEAPSAFEFKYDPANFELDRVELREHHAAADLVNSFRKNVESCCPHCVVQTCFLCRETARCERIKAERAAKALAESPLCMVETRATPEPTRKEKPEAAAPKTKSAIYLPRRRPINKIAQCEHGGYIIEGFARCGICQNIGDTADSFGIFLESLHDIAGRAAASRKTKSHRCFLSYDDLRSEGFLQILLNLQTITSAENPQAMAFVVAQGKLRNLKKKASNQREIVVSDFAITDEEGVTENSTNALDRVLDDYQQKNKAHFLDLSSSKGWKPKYLRDLETIIEDQMNVLHRENPRTLKILKLRLGLYREAGEFSVEEVADLESVSARTVQREFSRGLERLRQLLRKALPTNVRFLRGKDANKPVN